MSFAPATTYDCPVEVPAFVSGQEVSVKEVYREQIDQNLHPNSLEYMRFDENCQSKAMQFAEANNLKELAENEALADCQSKTLEDFSCDGDCNPVQTPPECAIYSSSVTPSFAIDIRKSDAGYQMFFKSCRVIIRAYAQGEYLNMCKPEDQIVG